VGGMDKLKGLKIANIHHDSAYGKETIPVLEKQSEKYGFEFKNFPVAHPGLDQKAVWLQIRQYKPDWIILRGWGVMNPTALKEAARISYPSDHIVGVWWSGADEDVIPAGDAAKGYIAAGFHAAGKDFPVIQDIIKTVYGAGEGELPKERIGTIYYNRGVVWGIFATEAIRTTINKFGNRAIGGEEMQWALEHLDLSPERIAALGASGLMPPVKLSCLDHEGGGRARFMQWDGSKWNMVSEWIDSDQAMVRPMIEASAAKYAKEKGIQLRDCK
jgi:branched-chain amino acid transport system substrate-binding protein